MLELLGVLLVLGITGAGIVAATSSSGSAVSATAATDSTSILPDIAIGVVFVVVAGLGLAFSKQPKRFRTQKNDSFKRAAKAEMNRPLRRPMPHRMHHHQLRLFQ